MGYDCDGKMHSILNLWAFGVTDSGQLLRPSLPRTGPTVESFQAGFMSLAFQVSICSHGIGPCIHSSSAPLETQFSHRLDQLPHQSRSPRWFHPDSTLPRFAAQSTSSSTPALPFEALLVVVPSSFPSPSKLCGLTTSSFSSYVPTVTPSLYNCGAYLSSPLIGNIRDRPVVTSPIFHRKRPTTFG